MKNNEGALRPKMAAALLLVLFRKIRGWDHNPKQLNNQQRGQLRSLFRRKTGCRGWGYKQSRPLPRAVRAATLCLRCSQSLGRELQIRRKKTIATILATTQGRNSNFKLAYPLSKRFFSEADPSGKETGILDKFLDQPGLSDAPPTIDHDKTAVTTIFLFKRLQFTLPSNKFHFGSCPLI